MAIFEFTEYIETYITNLPKPGDHLYSVPFIRMLANGDTIEELLEEYPSVERGDILACFLMDVPLFPRPAFSQGAT